MMTTTIHPSHARARQLRSDRIAHALLQAVEARRHLVGALTLNQVALLWTDAAFRSNALAQMGERDCAHAECIRQVVARLHEYAAAARIGGAS
jgi:hypothetical protein